MGREHAGRVQQRDPAKAAGSQHAVAEQHGARRAATQEAAKGHRADHAGQRVGGDREPNEQADIVRQARCAPPARRS